MDSTVEEIKSKIDIIDLISEYVELKKAGQNYKGLCPFHSEKTPSFMVSPSKQIFHCFGCGKGGDIFSFVMNYENMTFHEALSYLSKKAGINEVKSQKSKTISSLKENLLAIYKEAFTFFQNNLKNSNQALTYLKNRGISSETIEKFSLGFSKNEKDSLFNHLKKQGFQQEHIKASGLVHFNPPLTNGELNSAYDFFRNRLMFPIFDLQGRVIAFGGRILSSLNNSPKYINSSDSPLFKKGETSYGLNMAKNSITQKKYTIIVEGYFDVLMCHQNNFTNAIAPLGTALTLGQIEKLKRFSNKVLLIFDGDSAGISATKRSLELCFAEGMIAKILLLPKGEDPDTFLRKHGEEKFRKYMSKAVSPVDFLLKVYSKSKLDAIRNMLRLIIVCPDPLQRDETIRELAEKSKINELTIREELKNIIPKKYKSVGKRQKSSDLDYHHTNREEKVLLNIALSRPNKANVIVNYIDPQIIEDPVVKRVFEKIKALIDNGHELSIERLLSVCDTVEQKLITMHSINPEIDEEHLEESMKDCLKKIKLREIQRQIISASEAGDLKLLRFLLFEKKKAIGGDIERFI